MNDQQRMGRPLAETDPEIFDAIQHEVERQNTRLELIASENFTSEAVLEATGSVFTNKYAEGYPGKRYYGGCEFADIVENLARERAKKLFNAEYVNVQPHSGSQANEAAYASVLQPGDTILGMNLAHGGHLTHGHPLNFSGKLYKVVAYGVRREDELIDYEELARLADEHKPKMIIAGASAYSRVIDFARFREIADVSWGSVRGRYGALFRADCCRYLPEPVRARRHRHLDDAQNFTGPACWRDLREREVWGGYRQSCLSRRARRPAGTCDSGKGCLLSGSTFRRVSGVSTAGIGECAGARSIASERRFSGRERWNRLAHVLD